MTNIHESAIVKKGAQLGANVKIGPFCIVGENVILEDNVELKSHVIIENKVRIGKASQVHPFAVIGGNPQNLTHKGEGAEVIIGANVIIREYVTINIGTEGDDMKTIIGDNCFIMTSAHIAHDCKIGNNVIMANCATLGGHVKIDDRAFIGGMVAVHQFAKIGKFAMIGGFSGIERDIPPFAMAIGSRAKIVGLNIIGLKRNGFKESDVNVMKKAFGTLFNSKMSTNQALEFLKQNGGDSACIKELICFLDTKTNRGLSPAEVSYPADEKIKTEV